MGLLIRSLPHVAVRAPLAGPLVGAHAEMLSDGALNFLARLARRFEPERQQLLRQRRGRQRELDAGALPDFRAASRRLRQETWQVAAPPAELARRRVEVAGPVARRAIQQGLRSGADVCLADFGDMHAPTWRNNLDGQVALREAVRGGTDRGMAPLPAPLLMVRPRGWHLDERHLLVDGAPVAAALFDFGLFLYHNAAGLRRGRTHPYFYLAKLENHLEARLWAQVFAAAQADLGLESNAICATIEVDNILAAFEMDEMLWELRGHAVGLARGGAEYPCSFIRKFSRHRAFLLPALTSGAMASFVRPPHARGKSDGVAALARLLVATCRRRGVSAIGELCNELPVGGDVEADWSVLDRIVQTARAEREAGYDTVRVAYPGFVAVAQLAWTRAEERDAREPRSGPGSERATEKAPAARSKARSAAPVTAAALLAIPAGEIPAARVQAHLDLVLRYLCAWLGGSGRVPLQQRLQDAAAVELARAQLWQWAQHRAVLRDGRRVSPLWLRHLCAERLWQLRRDGELDPVRLNAAGLIVERLCSSPDFAEFFTVAAYEFLG